MKSFDNVVEILSIKEEQDKKLKEIILSGKNILISGHTGHGKTLLLRYILQSLPQEDKFAIVAEDDSKVLSELGHVEVIDQEELYNQLYQVLSEPTDTLVYDGVRGEVPAYLVETLKHNKFKRHISTIIASSIEDAQKRFVQGLSLVNTEMALGDLADALDNLSDALDHYVHIRKDREGKFFLEIK